MNQQAVVFIRSFKTYWKLILSTVLLLIFISIFAYSFYDPYNRSSPISTDFFKKWLVMLVFSSMLFLILLIFGIKGFWKFVRSTNQVVLTSDSISIGEKSFNFEDIDEIKTIDIGHLSKEPFYGAAVILKNGETKFIPGENYYKHDHKLFKALEDINQSFFSELKQEETHVLIDKEEKISEQKNKGHYDFNSLTSIKHLLYFFLIAVSLFGTFKYLDNPIAFFLSGIALVVYFIAMRSSSYFEIDGYRLIVKNKMLFGYSRKYDLEEIKCALIYTKGVARNYRTGIRIITHDYKSKFYSCNRFSSKKWNAMAQTLRANDVYVINKFEKTME